ncbi:Transcription factor [Akanthomyces lecanii RCEF 1005]|uniref:Transcription factor n=1 Tax=Akanthomyces lecanii RCEF 1005 TaxID=1081108 RepID=A0A168FAN1_CORDF|nr:Transcription factor [Akanthomyces lecanii RCEF 1005]
MREDLLSAKQVIKALLNHVGGSQALAQLAEGQAAEAIVASLLGRHVPATAATPTPIIQQHPSLVALPKDRSSELDPEDPEATKQTMLSPSLIDQPIVPDVPTSWDWFESNYQLASTHQATDGPTVPGVTCQPLVTRQDGPVKFLSAQQSAQGTITAPGSWTTVTNDIELVHHLLALFFCWEYPTFVTLSREHFIEDFRSGSHRYCSPILVNAILATGCRFSNQLVGRRISDDPFSAGDLFFQESERLLECETNPHSLPVIQALSIMSLREISCGRQPSAKYLAGQAMRLAFEMGLHAPKEAEHTSDDLLVLSATFWGVYTLDK